MVNPFKPWASHSNESRIMYDISWINAKICERFLTENFVQKGVLTLSELLG